MCTVIAYFAVSYPILQQHGRSFIDFILVTDYKPDRLSSLLSHEYAYLCYDVFFQSESYSLKILGRVKNDQTTQSSILTGVNLTPSNADMEMIQMMLNRWTTEYRPQLHESLLSSTSMADVWIDMCIQYIDGSNPQSNTSMISSDSNDEWSLKFLFAERSTSTRKVVKLEIISTYYCNI